MADMRTGTKPTFMPASVSAKNPVSTGSAVNHPAHTTAPKPSGNPEAFKAAQKQTEKTLGVGQHGGGQHGGGHVKSGAGEHHAASTVHGDLHKEHDLPGVVSHKTHLTHGALEGVVAGAEKAAHTLGHSKAGQLAHVAEHGAHKLAGKVGVLGVAASWANAANNPSIKSAGEATSTTLTQVKTVVQAKAAVAATQAAKKVLVNAAGRSGSTVTAAIVKKEAPKIAAAVAKTVESGKVVAKVAEATKVATSALVKSGVKTTAAVVAKAAPAAAHAAGAAAAKAGGRFVPGLNVAIAVVDVAVAGADIHKAITHPSTKNTTVAIVSGITALGSGIAATNIPVVSQVGAGVSLVAGLGKAALESFWPD